MTAKFANSCCDISRTHLHLGRLRVCVCERECVRGVKRCDCDESWASTVPLQRADSCFYAASSNKTKATLKQQQQVQFSSVQAHAEGYINFWPQLYANAWDSNCLSTRRDARTDYAIIKKLAHATCPAPTPPANAAPLYNLTILQSTPVHTPSPLQSSMCALSSSLFGRRSSLFTRNWSLVYAVVTSPLHSTSLCNSSKLTANTIYMQYI